MNINDLTPTEYDNCLNMATRESFEQGREIRVEDIINREITLAKMGFSKIVELKVGRIVSNLNNTFIIEYSDGKVSKLKLVNDFDPNNDAENVVTLESRVGKFLDTATEGDVYKFNDVEFVIVRIQKPSPGEQATA